MAVFVVFAAILFALPTCLRLGRDIILFRERTEMTENAKSHGRTALAHVVWRDMLEHDDTCARCVYEFSHLGTVYKVERDGYFDGDVRVYWAEGNPDGAVFDFDSEYSVTLLIMSLTMCLVTILFDIFLACIVSRVIWG